METEKAEVERLQGLLAEMETEKDALSTLVASEPAAQPINVCKSFLHALLTGHG